MLMPVPDAGVIARRESIVARLRAVIGAGTVIDDPVEARAYECDALSAYRCPPLAVALPTTTEEVAAVLRVCHEERVPVVPRGAGTSLAGGAIPQEDAVVIGVSRMSRILEVDYDNRTATVQAGATNLSISDRVAADGFFYAPDPSSQLACTIAGNIAMNSGGAHCLKYGVTTNNLLGARLVLMDGTIIELGGKALDAPGLDLLGLLCGSEGQIGIITEATVRLLARPEGARPVLFGFDSSEVAGACVSEIIGSGIIPVAIEFMDKPAIEICEAFAKAGYPLDVEALLIVEVEGAEGEIAEIGRGAIREDVAAADDVADAVIGVVLVAVGGDLALTLVDEITPDEAAVMLTERHGPTYRKVGGRVLYALRDLEAWSAIGTRKSTSDKNTGTVFAARPLTPQERDEL